MKGCSAFPKAPASLGPHDQIVLSHILDTRWDGVLPLCGEAVGEFYCPSRQGNKQMGDSVDKGKNSKHCELQI